VNETVADLWVEVPVDPANSRRDLPVHFLDHVVLVGENEQYEEDEWVAEVLDHLGPAGAVYPVGTLRLPRTPSRASEPFRGRLVPLFGP
jgi:hypothetical protein